GQLLGLDRDAEALALAAQQLAASANRCVLKQENFTRAAAILSELAWDRVDGVLLDLGFSSLQIEDAGRGFSFVRPGPLDMRMDRHQGRSAADIVNRASEAELAETFRELGEEPAARALARAIVRTRTTAPITTTTALVDVVTKIVKKTPRTHLHPATRV